MGFVAELIRGDCLEVIKDIPDNSIDLIIIDPPYLTTKEKWDKKEVVNSKLSSELFRVAKDHCSLYVWCGIGEKSQSLIRWFPIFSNDWHFKDLITWKKQRGIGMRKGWLYTREEIMWFVKNNKNFIWNIENQYLDGITRKRDKYRELLGENGKPFKSKYKRISNVWDDFTEQGRDVTGFSYHYTPKPLVALKRIIKSHSQEGYLVLDCFMGSGATGVACKELNRNFIGIELDENYFNIAKQRIENYKNEDSGQLLLGVD